MARRFDLGMSLNYCESWGVVEAVRELFQNALDEEIVNSENKMYFHYDADSQVLRVGNKNSNLATKTLLLGVSSKRDDNKTIGQHGEGYKVATVVLTRLGKQIKIYNRANKEVWTSKVIKSRRYGTDVVVFDIEKVSVFKSVPNHDLIFEVTGITQEDYDAIVESNLHLQDGIDVKESDEGRVLLDERFKGKLYVKGLFVCKSKRATYGYDFNPSLVKLDRDRGFIDNLDLQFLCGKVLCGTNDIEFVKEAKDTWDGEYCRFYLNKIKNQNCVVEMYEQAYTEFKETYGEDAIPCDEYEEARRLTKRGYNAVYLDYNTYHYVSSSTSCKTWHDVTEEAEVDKEELADNLESWFNDEVSKYSDVFESGSELIEKVLSVLREG